MKPKLVFFLAPRIPFNNFTEWRFTDLVENDIIRIQKFIRKKKADSNSLQIIYVDNDTLKIAAEKANHLIGSVPTLCISKMFPISSHIIHNQLAYETSLFNKHHFALLSRHNKRLISNIVQQSLIEVPAASTEISIFIVDQRYLETEWPYNPSFLDMMEANTNNSFVVSFSPIAIDFQSQSITNL